MSGGWYFGFFGPKGCSLHLNAVPELVGGGGGGGMVTNQGHTRIMYVLMQNIGI